VGCFFIMTFTNYMLIKNNNCIQNRNQATANYHNSKSQQYYQTKPKVVNWEHELTKRGYCARNLIILIFSKKNKKINGKGPSFHLLIMKSRTLKDSMEVNVPLFNNTKSSLLVFIKKRFKYQWIIIYGN